MDTRKVVREAIEDQVGYRDRCHGHHLAYDASFHEGVTPPFLLVFFDEFFEFIHVPDSDDFLDGLSVSEEDHRRDRAYLEAIWDTRFVIDIVLHDAHLALHHFRELFEYWSHHLTWSAPGSPEVDEHESFQGIASEVRVSRGIGHIFFNKYSNIL